MRYLVGIIYFLVVADFVCIRFKVVKSLGVKGAPKITIALLDQEDLRALAHLMNSYTPVLKEKALSLAVTK